VSHSALTRSFSTSASTICGGWRLRTSVRLLASDDPRWCLAVGAAIGLGMLTKYTMIFLAVGIDAGFLFTPARRYLRSPWPWCGIRSRVRDLPTQLPLADPASFRFLGLFGEHSRSRYPHRTHRYICARPVLDRDEPWDLDDSREVRPFIREIRPRWCWHSPAYEAAVDDQIDARAEGRRLAVADSLLSSASDRTRGGAALWLIHVENLTKRRATNVLGCCAPDFPSAPHVAASIRN
jgi:hypothetical protein